MMTARWMLALVCVLGAAMTQATTVLPMNLAQISEDAQSAFVVKIDSAEAMTSGTRSFDLIKGVIVEPLFGDVRTSQAVSWKQFRFAANRPMMGMPTYEAGKEYLIFLSGPASGTGFQLPIGLGQGTFDVVRNRSNGAARVKNESGNAWLTRGLDVQAVSEDLAAREARTRGMNAAAQRERAVEIRQKLRPVRVGNSLDVIKDAARFFHEKKVRGGLASREYLTSGTAVGSGALLVK